MMCGVGTECIVCAVAPECHLPCLQSQDKEPDKAGADKAGPDAADGPALAQYDVRLLYR